MTNNDADDFYYSLVDMAAPVVKNVAENGKKAAASYFELLDSMELLIVKTMGEEKAKRRFSASEKHELGLVYDSVSEEVIGRAVAEAAVEYYSPESSSMSHIREANWNKGIKEVWSVLRNNEAQASEFVTKYFDSMQQGKSR